MRCSTGSQCSVWSSELMSDCRGACRTIRAALFGTRWSFWMVPDYSSYETPPLQKSSNHCDHTLLCLTLTLFSNLMLTCQFHFVSKWPIQLVDLGVVLEHPIGSASLFCFLVSYLSLHKVMWISVIHCVAAELSESGVGRTFVGCSSAGNVSLRNTVSELHWQNVATFTSLPDRWLVNTDYIFSNDNNMHKYIRL